MSNQTSVPFSPLHWLCWSAGATHSLGFLCSSTRGRKYPSFQSAIAMEKSIYWKPHILDVVIAASVSSGAIPASMRRLFLLAALRPQSTDWLPIKMDWFPTHNLCASSVYYSNHSLCALAPPYGLWSYIYDPADIAFILQFFSILPVLCEALKISTNGLKLTLASCSYRYNKVHHTQVLWKYLTYFNFPNYSFPAESSRH